MSGVTIGDHLEAKRRARLFEELAMRCESEAPSFDLDQAIAEAVAGHEVTPPFLRFGTSLDAAVTLQPEWWRLVHLEQYLARTGDWGVTLKAYNPASADNAYVSALAKTEPMARCAAALRARAALEGK